MAKKDNGNALAEPIELKKKKQLRLKCYKNKMTEKKSQETSPPVNNLSFKQIKKDLKPTIKKMKNDDEKLASLVGGDGWKVLKRVIEAKVEEIETNTRVSSDNMSEVDDLQMLGFKVMSKDLLVEALCDIIKLVETTSKVIKENKKDDK